MNAKIAKASLKEIENDARASRLRPRRGRRRLRAELRALPWRRRARLAWLSQSQRQPLDLGRHARSDLHDDRAWRALERRSEDPYDDDAGLRPRRRLETGADVGRRRLCSHAFRQCRDTWLPISSRARKSSPTIAPPAMAPQGKGNIEIGAPNLTTKIWLYGPTKADILASYPEWSAAATSCRPGAAASTRPRSRRSPSCA